MTDGAELTRDGTLRCDVVVIGSGPRGATTARALAREGVDVVLVEEGRWVATHEARQAPLTPLSNTGKWGSPARGAVPIPLLQGRVLGGTSLVNSGICWRMLRDTTPNGHGPMLASPTACGSRALDAAAADLEWDLGIAPTNTGIAGTNNLLMAKGAAALGLDHQPTRRNVGVARASGAAIKGAPSAPSSRPPGIVAAGRFPSDGGHRAPRVRYELAPADAARARHAAAALTAWHRSGDSSSATTAHAAIERVAAHRSAHQVPKRVDRLRMAARLIRRDSAALGALDAGSPWPGRVSCHHVRL